LGGYAVIAYIHSGDFSNGSPFEIDPFQLVFKQKVIVVTIAFRLGILGFFTTLDGESIGNFGEFFHFLHSKFPSQSLFFKPPQV
jgi:carboxylesterase type B